MTAARLRGFSAKWARRRGWSLGRYAIVSGIVFGVYLVIFTDGGLYLLDRDREGIVSRYRDVGFALEMLVVRIGMAVVFWGGMTYWQNKSAWSESITP